VLLVENIEGYDINMYLQCFISESSLCRMENFSLIHLVYHSVKIKLFSMVNCFITIHNEIFPT
jgi:hypothetical protein